MLGKLIARFAGVRAITPHQLERLLQAPAPPRVYDVNPPRSWHRHHVPGAHHLAQADYPEAELPADKTIPLVFYCADARSRAAPSAARRAKKLGYRNARVMRAGIRGWIRAGLPTQAE